MPWWTTPYRPQEENRTSPSIKVGDCVAPNAFYILKSQAQCAIAENGVVIWVGSHDQFCKLVRDAGRTARQ